MRTGLLTLIRFGAAGGATFVINIALTAFLHQGLGVAAEIAFALSLGSILLISFFACRYVIFKTASEGNVKSQALWYLVSTLGFRGAEYLAFLLVHTMLGVYYLVAILGILSVSFFAKFFCYHRMVFVTVGGRSASVEVEQRR